MTKYDFFSYLGVLGGSYVEPRVTTSFSYMCPNVKNFAFLAMWLYPLVHSYGGNN